jgi:hypothetical protein
MHLKFFQMAIKGSKREKRSLLGINMSLSQAQNTLNHFK